MANHKQIIIYNGQVYKQMKSITENACNVCDLVNIKTGLCKLKHCELSYGQFYKKVQPLEYSSLFKKGV